MELDLERNPDFCERLLDYTRTGRFRVDSDRTLSLVSFTDTTTVDSREGDQEEDTGPPQKGLDDTPLGNPSLLFLGLNRLRTRSRSGTETHLA